MLLLFREIKLGLAGLLGLSLASLGKTTERGLAMFSFGKGRARESFDTLK